MKDILERLIKVAREWREFSLNVNGWSSGSYCDGKVNCYFADGSDYSTVSFEVNKISFGTDKIEVSFHSTPQVCGFTVRSANLIELRIIQFTELLEIEKAKRSDMSLFEIEQEKSVRIESLKSQLLELEKE